MPLLFSIFVLFKLMFSHGKRGFQNSIFINISFSFGQNFMKLHGDIVYLKFHHVPLFFYLCVFQFDALSWKKGVSCKMSLTHSILESILLIHLENLRLTDKPLENCIFWQCLQIIHYCSKIIIINIPKLYITREIIKCSIKWYKETCKIHALKGKLAMQT